MGRKQHVSASAAGELPCSVNGLPRVGRPRGCRWMKATATSPFLTYIIAALQTVQPALCESACLVTNTPASARRNATDFPAQFQPCPMTLRQAQGSVDSRPR
jgi:hypothetical protein